MPKPSLGRPTLPAVILSCTLVQAALAQDALLPPVTVTAQKRATSVDEIIGSATAVSGDAVERYRMTDTKDLFSSVPGLQMQEYGGFPAQTTVMLRGIGADRPELEGAVQINQDGAAMPTAEMANFFLFDVERAEILRGPQSTLYGRSAEGGVVNLVSRRPTETFEGRAALGVNDFGGRSAEMALSGSIVPDRLRSRLAFISSDEDGERDNPATGKSLNGRTVKAARLINSLKLTDRLNAELLLQGGELRHRAMAGYFFVGGRPVLNASSDPYDTETKANNGVLTVNWDGGDFSLISLTTRASADSTGQGMAPFITGTHQYNRREYDGWTQEVRLASKGRRTLDWLAGIYYASGDRGETLRAQTAYGRMNFHTDQDKKTTAVFGDLTWNLGDAFRLSAGARLARDTTRISGNDSMLVFSQSYRGERSDTTLSPKIGAAYDFTPNHTAYGLVSHGYKAGSFNTINTFSPLAPSTNADAYEYGRETVINYEIGSKYRLPDRRLTVNTALYYMDWRDKQVYNLDAATFAVVTSNAGRASSYGLELDAQWQATPSLSLRGGLALGNSRYDRYTDPNGVEYDGKQMEYFSRLSALLAVDWQPPGFDRRLSLSGSARYRSRHYFDMANTQDQGGLVLVDAFVNYDFDRFRVSLWSKNLFDRDYVTYKVRVGSGAPTGTIGAGRQIGLSLSADF
ncbi:MAG: TonB-dependent receptor [Rhodocyclaceae bacterium]|nr:TonB-dependent receptor [Rhodocyclaceae bacterium]